MDERTFRGGLYALLAAGCLWVSAASSAVVDVTLEAAVSQPGLSAPSQPPTIIDLGQVDTSVSAISTFTGTTPLDGTGTIEYTVTVDPDPFIQANFTVTNPTAVAQIFDLTFMLPVMPLPGPNVQTGSLAANFSDANGSGAATLNILNWAGLIDGGVAMSLISGSFSCSGGPNCTGSIAPVSNGPIPAGSVATDIGINVKFSLTAGDSATFDTRYEVVPLPAAAWLFGSGLVALVGLARRRKQIQ